MFLILHRLWTLLAVVRTLFLAARPLLRRTLLSLFRLLRLAPALFLRALEKPITRLTLAAAPRPARALADAQGRLAALRLRSRILALLLVRRLRALASFLLEIRPRVRLFFLIGSMSARRIVLPFLPLPRMAVVVAVVVAPAAMVAALAQARAGPNLWSSSGEQQKPQGAAWKASTRPAETSSAASTS